MNNTYFLFYNIFVEVDDIMDWNKLLNIKNINIERNIRGVILGVKDELSELTQNQTCMIYSSYVFRSLREKGVNAKIINTEKIGFLHKHYFVLVPDENKYFLIDLTFSQFGNKSMPILLKNGYQEINNNIFNNYLDIVTNNEEHRELDINEVYFDSLVRGER